MILTFPEHWKVDFGDFAVEPEDGLQMRLDDVPAEVGDDHHLGMWLFDLVSIHVDF